MPPATLRDRTDEVTPTPPAPGADLSAAVLLAVSVAVAVAAALCAWDLGSRPLWLDEAISRSATTQLPETLDRTSATMGLYYVLLTGWTTVFGDGVVAVRSLSVVFTAATVVLTFALARRLVGQREAVVASFVLALMPAATRYGQEARSYALTALIATASWYCLTRAMAEDDGADRSGSAVHPATWWRAVAALSTLGVLAHGLFVLQVVTQGASLLMAGHRVALRRFAPAIALSGLLGLVLFQSGAKHIANWVPPLALDQVVDSLALLLGPTWPTAAVAAALSGLGIAELLRRRRSSADPLARWRASVPVLWAFGPLLLLIALSTVRPYLHPRYVVGSLPGTAILMSVGLSRLRRLTRTHWPAGARIAVVAAAGLLVATLLAGQWAIRSEPPEDWRAAARIVATEADREDLVLFTQPDIKLAFDAAWSELSPSPGASPVVGDPHGPLGEPHRFSPKPDPLVVERQVAATDRVWVVHRTMSSGDGLLAGVLATPNLDGPFTTVAHHRFDGGVQVVVLERSDL